MMECWPHCRKPYFDVLCFCTTAEISSQYMKENVNLKCGQKLSRFIFAVYEEAKFKKRKFDIF